MANEPGRPAQPCLSHSAAQRCQQHYINATSRPQCGSAVGMSARRPASAAARRVICHNRAPRFFMVQRECHNRLCANGSRGQKICHGNVKLKELRTAPPTTEATTIDILAENEQQPEIMPLQLPCQNIHIHGCIYVDVHMYICKREFTYEQAVGTAVEKRSQCVCMAAEARMTYRFGGDESLAKWDSANECESGVSIEWMSKWINEWLWLCVKRQWQAKCCRLGPCDGAASSSEWTEREVIRRHFQLDVSWYLWKNYSAVCHMRMDARYVCCVVIQEYSVFNIRLQL